jgi:hypothetical protein
VGLARDACDPFGILPRTRAIEPEHAVDAVFDPCRLVAGNPKSRTGEAIQVVGYSAGMGPGSGRAAGAGRPSTELAVAHLHRVAGGRRTRRAYSRGRGTRMADKELLDRIAAAAEDAEATADDELEWTPHREPAKSPAAVYSARIPVDRIEELRQLAADRGVQPTGVARPSGRVDRWMPRDSWM